MRKLWLTVAALALAASAVQAQTYTLLYNFGSNQGDPANPWGILAQGPDGDLYGTSSFSSGSAPLDAFKFTPSGNLTVLDDLSGPEDSPGGLTLGTNRRLYGVIPYSGTTQQGAVFKLTSGGSFTTLYSFTGEADGFNPLWPPVEGIDGDFYGTTAGFGVCNTGCGTVYKITPSGTLVTLHSFNGTDGLYPYSQLVQATNGVLYGTTLNGGPDNKGTVFEVSNSGKFSVVFDFHGTDGEEPTGGLIQASDGALYGVTILGGASNAGVLFKISHGTYTVLHSFTGASGGRGPFAGLVQATDGNLYGTTGATDVYCGTIFRITTSGEFTTLYKFPSDGSLGCVPDSNLLQHTNGRLYGTTEIGGTASEGTFFSFDVGLGPFVSFLPAARQVGHTVEILGQGLSGTTAVSFNGTPASFTLYANSYYDTYLTAIVPNGATTGFITVTTPSGTLTSNKQFQVKPQITGFSPTSGPPGTSVVVTGVSLTQTSKITFNSVVATSFTVNSDTQVTVTVPAGATSSKIGVTTTGAPVYSATAFTVTQ